MKNKFLYISVIILTACSGKIENADEKKADTNIITTSLKKEIPVSESMKFICGELNRLCNINLEPVVISNNEMSADSWELKQLEKYAKYIKLTENNSISINTGTYQRLFSPNTVDYPFFFNFQDLNVDMSACLLHKAGPGYDNSVLLNFITGTEHDLNYWFGQFIPETSFIFNFGQNFDAPGFLVKIYRYNSDTIDVLGELIGTDKVSFMAIEKDNLYFVVE